MFVSDILVTLNMVMGNMMTEAKIFTDDMPILNRPVSNVVMHGNKMGGP